MVICFAKIRRQPTNGTISTTAGILGGRWSLKRGRDREPFSRCRVRTILTSSDQEKAVPAYHVEEMEGDAITATHLVNATTPIRAAREATEREVTLRTNEVIWIRVTDEKRGHTFEYTFSL